MENTLNNFINNVKSNIPGYLGISITDIESGEALVSNSKSSSFDPELASALNLQVIKSKLKAIRALNIDQEVKDIVITLTNQYHLLILDPNGKLFYYLAVDSNESNLGICRTLINKYIKDLSDLI